jgi:Fe-S-cluster containining protein
MTAAASDLCRACGFCCDGTLFGGLLLTEDEARALDQVRLPLFQAEDGPTLLMPCPAHVGTCTIYAERPSTCRTYQCQLIDRLEQGDIDFESALLRVERLRALADAIRPRLGHITPGEGGFWERADALQQQPLEWQIENEGLMLQIATLREMLARFIDARSRSGPVTASRRA